MKEKERKARRSGCNAICTYFVLSLLPFTPTRLLPACHYQAFHLLILLPFLIPLKKTSSGWIESPASTTDATLNQAAEKHEMK